MAAAPDRLALLACRADRAEGKRFTYAELGDAVSRAAASLVRMGIGRGDVIAVQLPNWWEFAVVTLAAFRVGAVVNPLMPIFRERELSYMLDFSEAKAFVVPKIFRGFDHEEMAKALQTDLPKLAHVIVVDGEGPDSFDATLLASGERVAPPPVGEMGVLAGDDMAVLMFTSGTTGSPKGVMHCLNTLMACNVSLAGRFGLDETDTMLVCSPLGHMTGFAAGMLLGFKIGASVIFQDVWEPKRGVSIMAEEGVTYSAGAATFLSDMCEAVAVGAPKPAQLRKFLCAGAPIPPALIERVYSELDLSVCSLWGMTESLSSTLTEPERALEKSSKTDGRPLDGVGIKVVRMDGTAAPVGETGSLRVRGAQMCLGYYKRPDMEPFDAGGWFDTGDLAYRVDDEDYIRINGRSKDIIIRGGENIPIVEIENLLYKHPAVLAAALVGYPDSRLGERACAFVVLRPGQTLDLPSLQAYMAGHKVAKQYWPERLQAVADLPKTPAGKVQKFQLKEQARAFGDAPQKASA
jgi:cyclohexanecarboxylate-CoA ligase